jgi:hypothetical protein
MHVSSGAQILVTKGRQGKSTLSGAVGHRFGILSFDDLIGLPT